MSVERGPDGRCYLGDNCYPGHCTWYLDDKIEQLTAERDELAREVETLKTRVAYADDTWGEIFEDAKRYRAEVDRLRTALKLHGRHSDARGDDGSVLPPACDIYRGKPCDCGLSAALLEGSEP